MSNYIDLVLTYEEDTLYYAPAFSGLQEHDRVLVEGCTTPFEVFRVTTETIDSNIYNFIVGMAPNENLLKILSKVTYTKFDYPEEKEK